MRGKHAVKCRLFSGNHGNPQHLRLVAPPGDVIGRGHQSTLPRSGNAVITTQPGPPLRRSLQPDHERPVGGDSGEVATRVLDAGPSGDVRPSGTSSHPVRLYAARTLSLRTSASPRMHQRRTSRVVLHELRTDV